MARVEAAERGRPQHRDEPTRREDQACTRSGRLGEVVRAGGACRPPRQHRPVGRGADVQRDAVALPPRARHQAVPRVRGRPDARHGRGLLRSVSACRGRRASGRSRTGRLRGTVVGADRGPGRQRLRARPGPGVRCRPRRRGAGLHTRVVEPVARPRVQTRRRDAARVRSDAGPVRQAGVGRGGQHGRRRVLRTVGRARGLVPDP